METSSKNEFNLGFLADLRLLALVFALILYYLLRFILIMKIYELFAYGVFCVCLNWCWNKITRVHSVECRKEYNEKKKGRVNVCIVGSGFSGICMAVALKRENIPFTLFEKSEDIGGTWFDNKYPGCACDVWTPIYQFSFFRNPDWSQFVAPALEIKQYLAKVIDVFDLKKHIHLKNEIQRAKWDEEKKQWAIKTKQDEQEMYFSYIISGCGSLRSPLMPTIPGIETFKHKSFHSQNWDTNYDYKGKRVAIIGSAASAVQIAPAIANDVEKLYIFQRTPNWHVKKVNPIYPNWLKLVFRCFPWTMWILGSFTFHLLEFNRFLMFRTGWISSLLQKLLAMQYKDILQNDQNLIAKLTPEFAVGCKRVLFTDSFLPMLVNMKSKVHLITDEISKIYEDGVLTNGNIQKYEVDLIVYATGFSNENSIFGFETIGREEKNMREYFEDNPCAYLGISMPSFPNFFFVLGPNTILAHSSLVFMAECQTDYILDILKKVIKSQIDSLEVRKDVTKSFEFEMERLTSKMNFSGGCRSWYRRKKDNKNIILWPSNLYHYWWITRKSYVLRDYNITICNNQL